MTEESHLVDLIILTFEVEYNLISRVVYQPDFSLMPNDDLLIIHFEASLDGLIRDLDGLSDVKVLILILFTLSLYYLGQKFRDWLYCGNFWLFCPFFLNDTES
jgi:hypothetical protein